MPTTKHVKSVSWDDNHEFHSPPSYSPPESQRSESPEHKGKSPCIEQESDSDPLRVPGLREDSDASDVSFIIDDEDHLFRVSEGQWDALGRAPSPDDADDSSDNVEVSANYMEAETAYDEDSDYGSAEWDSDQSFVDDEVPQPHGTSAGSLFGERPWKSITPLKMVVDLMDAVNVNLHDFVLTAESKECEDSWRDIFPEHVEIVLQIASQTSKLSPEQVECELKRAIDSRQYICRRTPSKASLSTLELYEPLNSNFDNLEFAWEEWHRDIEEIQIDLISVINTRATLIEGGQKLLAWRNKAWLQHSQWIPEPHPIHSEHGKAHFAVGATFDSETGTHQLPKTLAAFGDPYELEVTTVVEGKNRVWVRLEKDVKKVMLGIRYAQMQFRNVQINLEHALLGDIGMLQKAIFAHEHLETEWGNDVLSQSDGSCDFGESVPSPVFRSTVEWMDSVDTTSDDIVNVEEFFNPRSTPLCLGPSFSDDGGADDRRRCSHSNRDSSTTSSEPPCIHSPPARRLKHNNPLESMDTTATSVDDLLANIEHDAAPNAASESTGQKGKPIRSKSKKSAHEVFSEVMKKHESAERVAREENYASPAEHRLHEFGLIDFENVRRIHRNIMDSITSNTDERGGLGLALRHFRESAVLAQRGQQTLREA